MDFNRVKQKMQDFFQKETGLAIGISLSAITIGVICYEAMHTNNRRSSVDSSKKFCSDEDEKKPNARDVIQVESKMTTKSEKLRNRIQKQILLPHNNDPDKQDKKQQTQKASHKNETLKKKKNKKVFQTDFEATDFYHATKVDKMENFAKQSKTPHDKLFFTLLAKVAKDQTEEGEN